ncbi:MAG: DUF1007 family protein [Beijerinckiaceae bacterium]|nr:DUF1007 family protein [Beijerinckiaceae bacterium]
MPGALAAALLAFALGAGAPAPALAHPHVFVAVKSVVVFGPDGRVTAVRHSWTFDDMYSAFAIQGLGGPGGKPSADELTALAKVNVEQLEETNYFTSMRASGRRVEFGAATDYKITMDDKRNLTLHFTAPLKEPASAGRALTMQVFDPSYYVAFDLEKKTPVTMASAPSGCTLNVVEPPPLAPEYQSRLNDSMGTNVSPGADFGIKLAARVVVACP